MHVLGVVGFALLSCRPQAPDLKRLPRVEVPFSGITDGNNPGATPVPESKAKPASPQHNQAAESPESGGAGAASDLPDPPAQNYLKFADYLLEYASGDVSVLSVELYEVKQPTPAERRLGRFAFELLVGRTLIERVRFDFPLLGASGSSEKDPMEAGLTSQVRLTVPHAERATRARILDRKTRKELELPWPPASLSVASAKSGP